MATYPLNEFTLNQKVINISLYNSQDQLLTSHFPKNVVDQVWIDMLNNHNLQILKDKKLNAVESGNVLQQSFNLEKVMLCEDDYDCIGFISTNNNKIVVIYETNQIKDTRFKDLFDFCLQQMNSIFHLNPFLHKMEDNSEHLQLQIQNYLKNN